MRGTAICLLTIGMLAPVVRAETAATLPSAVAPAVEKAVAEISGGDDKTRDAGLKKLEQVLGEQMRELIGSDDPETQSRVVGLLQFNESLAQWVLETLKLPEEEGGGKGQVDFCLRPDVLPKVAGLFLKDQDKRLEGVKELAKFEDAEAGGILLRLMEDQVRPVRMTALQMLKGRKATPAMVDALWKRAVEDGLRMNNSPLALKGEKMKQGEGFDENFANQACAILIELKPAEVNGKITEVLERVQQYYDGDNKGRAWLFDDRYYPLKGVCRLLKAYKPKEAYPVLYRIAIGKSAQGASMAYDEKNMPVVLNNKKAKKDPEIAAEEDARDKKRIKTTYYWSNRTLFIKLFVEMTGQSLEDYKLKQAKPMGDLWSVSTQEDEEKAVAKIKEWWAAHGKEYADVAPAGPGDKETK